MFVSNEWLNQHPGFADSLRKKSFNKSIFNAVVELFPKDAKLEIFEMEGSSSSLDSSLFIATTTHWPSSWERVSAYETDQHDQPKEKNQSTQQDQVIVEHLVEEISIIKHTKGEQSIYIHTSYPGSIAWYAEKSGDRHSHDGHAILDREQQPKRHASTFESRKSNYAWDRWR